MKTFSISLLCILLAQIAFAQENIILYGLRTNLSGGLFGGVDSIDLESINPATGEQDFLFTIDGARSVAAGSSSYNAEQDQYFFWGNDSANNQRLYNLDLSALDIATSPETADIIVDIEYSYGDGKVYGLRISAGDSSDPFNPVPGGLDLVELDLETGAATVVNELLDTEAVGQGNSTFDPFNNTFIFLGFNGGVASVVGVDVTTGETVFNTNVDSVEGQVLALEYDWTNERLLGIRQTSTFEITDPFDPANPFDISMENYLAEIDVETGQVSDISASPAFEDTGVAIGGVAFDQQSGTYITYVGDLVLGMISIETGQVFNTLELPEYLYEIQADNLVYAQALLAARSGDTDLGDVNLDGIINLLDISPFVELLANNNYLFAADVNEDGTVDFLDIAPFIGLLSGN